MVGFLSALLESYNNLLIGEAMTDTQKLERLAELANLPYNSHTSEDWDEELRLECELQNHPQYKSFLDQ